MNPRNLSAVILLMMVALLRFWPSVTAAAPLPDEMGYVRGITRVLAGSSPYPGGSYLYPPLVAVAGAWLWERLGQTAVLAALRFVNLLGLATVVWCAASWLPWRWRWRLAAGAAVIALAPIVRLAVEWGNLSLLVAGLVSVALLLWPRRPLAAGGLLGLSIAVKPLAPAALLALAVHRPRGGGRRHLLAAAAASGVSAVLVLGLPWARSMLTDFQPPRFPRTLSFHRLAQLLGLEGGMLALTAALLLATVVVVRLRPLGRSELAAVAVAASLASSPSVWSHAMTLALPLSAAALVTAAGRLRQAVPGERRRRRWEVVFVALGAAAILASEGATSIDHLSLWLQLPGVLPPVLAPAALAAYLCRVGVPEPPEGGREVPGG